MANVIAKTSSVPTAYADLVVTTAAKILFMIGTGRAEFEIAALGSDGSTYKLTSVTSEDLLRKGVLATPGAYKVRMVKVDGGPAGLDAV